MDSDTIPYVSFAVAGITALALLISIREMRTARRADPQLMIYISQPKIYPHQLISSAGELYSKFMAILISPGLVSSIVTGRQRNNDRLTHYLFVRGMYLL